jgi:DNA-binding response OmpR family regulator
MSEPKKILVVDDDPDIVESLRVVLESRSYQVLSASNAKEAQEQVKKERPDLIILDIMMPRGTEGFHFVWNLRNDASSGCQDVPILVLSAIHDTTSLRFYPDQSDGTYSPGEFLPVQDFLDKPVEPKELLRRVENLLRG